jgi:hypothetical protein
MRPDGLESHRQVEVDRRNAALFALAGLAELRVAERLDRLDAALGEITGDTLDQHPSQAAAGERRDHVRVHQQRRVGGHR